MRLGDIIQKVSEETGIPKKIVDRAYKAYWRAIREHITSLPLKDNLTDDEFKQLQPNINIPSIGKLYVTLDRYRRMKRINEKFNQLKKDKKEHDTH